MFSLSDMKNPKTYLIEILDYYKYKLENDLCTMDEINSVTKAIEKNMDISGTISDFANFYGVSETNIRSTINRKLIAKPKRKLLYPFHKFSDIVPDKWRNKR